MSSPNENIPHHSLLSEILNYNKKTAPNAKWLELDPKPRKRLAVVACMDCRLPQLLEASLGFDRGDAIEIKNAGATIPIPDQKRKYGDIIRSLSVAIYALDVREVIVIGHTDCGLAKLSLKDVLQSMVDWKVDIGYMPPEFMRSQEVMQKWLGGFKSVPDNVREMVQEIRDNPYMPKELPVHGLVINTQTGELEVVTSGYPEVKP